VLLNLLSNAVKYSNDGDVIDVEARMQANALIISVSDTGPGIAKNQLPLLFQKFRRLPGSDEKAQGTGLGLVVARQIVEAHRGQLWVESELGKGSCFFISLPVDSSG
jgi:signal transduction histidine kinase